MYNMPIHVQIIHSILNYNIPIQGLESAESTQYMGPFLNLSSLPCFNRASTPTSGIAVLSSL